MYDPPSRRSQLMRQVIIPGLMVMTVLSLVFILILMVLGYRFSRADGIVVQGGLVQFDSKPAGADLTLDTLRLSSVTPANLTISSGSHTLTMTRDGYVPWRKEINVDAGAILWLTYARLIPVDLPVTNEAALPGVASSLASPNRKWFAIMTDSAAANVTLVDLSVDTPTLKQLTLPEGIFTATDTKDGEGSRLVSWDPSSRYVLVKHSFKQRAEWILVDTQNPAASKNLSALYAPNAVDVKFSSSNSRVVYILSNGDVRKINIDDATIPDPLIKGVAEFALYDRTSITYTTVLDPIRGQRSVGYYDEGSAKSRTIKTYADGGTLPRIAFGKYYGGTFVAVAHGETVDIFRAALPRSDEEDTPSLTPISTLAVPGDVTHLTNKTDGRFFVVQRDANFSVYDVELSKWTTTPLPSGSVDASELHWLDDHTLSSGRDGRARLYEFDGANQHDIMPIIPGHFPSLSPNDRYLYAPTKDDKGSFYLSRVRLTLR